MKGKTKSLGKRFLLSLGKMKNFLIFLPIFLFFSCKTHQYEQIQNSSTEREEYSVESIKEGDYNFPVLRGGDNEVTKRINFYLSNYYLELELGEEKESIFEKVKGNEQHSIPVLAFLKYEVERLNGKLYTLKINGEGCGAYCEEFESYHNFNLANGAYITIHDLFTKEGSEKLESEVVLKKRNQIKEQLAFANDELEKSAITEDDKEYFEMQIELYESCYDFHYELLSEYTDFYFSEDKTFLTIIIGRCSPHAIRAIDEIGDFEININLKDYSSLLSDLGRELLQ